MEYAQTLETPLDVILSTTLVRPETPKKGDMILHLKSVQLDPKTGASLQVSTGNAPLKDRSAMIDYGRSYIPTGHFDTTLVYQPSREFQKQPLGRAAYELARQSADSVVQNAGKLSASGDAPPRDQPKSCRMRLKVDYVEKKAISKSYTCIINEKEESLGIKEGVLEVEEPSSPLLIQIKVNDAPYNLRKQDVYLLDPTLDCSRGSNFLHVKIGAAGEAHTSWQ